MRHRNARATRAALVLIVAAALAATVTPSGGAAAPQPGAAAKPAVSAEKKPNYDARSTGSRLLVKDARALAKPSAGVRTLRHQLGTQGIVQIDPLTRTPRIVARVDGFLTRRSVSPPRNVALGYVLRHQDVFRLSGREVARLSLRKTYLDAAGTRHLSFVQQVRGIPVFGNGLRAHVTKDGRLLQVDGSPLARLPRNVGSPRISAVEARRLAIRDTYGRPVRTGALARTGADRATAFRNGDSARLVLIKTSTGLRLGWQTVTMSTGYQHVVDARSGRVLYRRNLVQSDTGFVWENYPGAPRGGQATNVEFTRKGWLPKNSPRLAGNVAHVYTDANDNNAADPGEEVGPSSNGKFRYPLVPFNPADCVVGFVCTWDPNTPGSWQTNRAQNAVQLLAFLGRFHDHLAKNPIGFTRAAGNFEAVDGDAVQGNAMDGAATGPDAAHVDNANMNTPPDGTPPLMQMYLFHQPNSGAADPFLPANSGDEADIVYHEYTHGLSNRLVVDALGNSTLGNIQAGSMGEAWSDWYAMDYLVNQRLFRDTSADGDLRVGQYVGTGQDLVRTQPVDCAVGSASALCPGTPGGGTGGYTYGDFGKIVGRPEVHADGEIWVETLWDLRDRIGSNLAESLVTRAMELSPANPSYLDMRNSILQADMAVRGGRDQAKIWTVFAGRGMGFFAGSTDGDDSTPVEDFSIPPTTTARGTLTGTVRDMDAGTPIAGAVVAFGGHNSGFGGDYAAVTNASGQYTIPGIIPGTYPKVFAVGGGGYDPNVQTVSVPAGTKVLDWGLRKDWAAIASGGTVTDFNGVDFSAFGCGPSAMIDQSQVSGWSSDTVYTGQVIDPRFAVIKLPVAVDVSEIVINPSNTCGDPGSSSTGDYSLETSTDGVTFNAASSGHFGVGDRKPTSIALNAGTTTDVQYVRYTMRSSQVADLGGTCPGPFGGCDFVDTVELAVYGTP